MQLRIISGIIARRRAIHESDLLVSQDMLQSIVDRVQLRMETLLAENAHLVRSFVVGAPAERTLTDLFGEICEESRASIAKLISFYDLPLKVLNQEALRRLEQTDYMQFVCGFKKQYPKITTQTVCSMAQILGLKQAIGKHV